MPTLSKRATPLQAQILRVVEGSIRDAVNSHPTWSFDPRFTKSIAKRAAGTLSALWPAGSAVAKPSAAITRTPSTGDRTS